MDDIDAFHQHLHSEQPLDERGPRLFGDAREILARAPFARLAGLILTPDSNEADPTRRAMEAASGETLPAGLLTGICPREHMEPALLQHVGTQHSQEEPGDPQSVLPVMVATRDGVRFGLFGLGPGLAEPPS